jgi:integrase/recombinase XerD
MSTTTIVSPTPVLFDEARLAVAGFLARYSGPTRTSYATDLRQFFAWCAQVDLQVFAVQRGHVELWARAM